MEEENRENGLTFGEIFRMVLHRIWYVLGVTLLVTLIAVLVVHFAVNPSNSAYSMQFSLLFPSGSENSYPDGEPFYYRDMIAKESLDEVKKTEGLSGIDTDGMIRKGEIEIVAETRSENGATVDTGRYTVSVKSAYFSGAEQAETFIRAIAQTIVDRLHTNAGEVNYAVSKETFAAAPFEERLNLLAQERETMLAKYDEWIETYDAAYALTVETGTGEETRTVTQSLKDYRASVTAIYGESVQEELENELKLGGYYYTADFEAYKGALKAEYGRNKTEIEALKGTGGVSSFAAVARTSVTELPDGSIIVESPVPNVSQRLAELIERNANILHWLGSEYLGEGGEPTTGTLTVEKNGEFAARLEAERVKLEQAAGLLTKVTKAIYDRGVAARFDMQRAETEGGVSIFLVAAVALVLTFLVACIVVCAIDRNRRKKEGQAPRTEEPQAPEEE